MYHILNDPSVSCRTNGRKARSDSGEPGGPRSITTPFSSAFRYFERERPDEVAARCSLVPFAKSVDTNCVHVSAFDIEAGRRRGIEAAAKARKSTTIFAVGMTPPVIASQPPQPREVASPAAIVHSRAAI